MANTKISEAGAVPAVADSDMLPVAKSGDATAYKMTIAQLKAVIDALYLALDGSGTMGGDLVIGAPGQTWDIWMSSADATYRWRIQTGDTVFNGVRDDLLFIGWNMNEGIPAAGGEVAWGMGFEANYKSAPAADAVTEWYICFRDAANTLTRRPIMCQVNRADNTVINTVVGKLAINSSTGTSTWSFADGGNLIAQTGKGVLNAVNNSAFIQQQNSGGSYRNLINMDASDRVVVAGNSDTILLKGPTVLTIQTAQPASMTDGMIVYADGTLWNPGSGEGFYGRENGAWVKL